MQKIIPLSPNVSSLMKYVEMPRGTFTGIPPIDIPVYTAQANGVSVPITLSYHAGGNKVEAIPSSIGLGWSISGVPMISRRIRGIADEKTGGFFFRHNGKTVKQLWDDRLGPVPGENNWREFLRQAIDGDKDTEADIYYYNIPGKSGRFFYDQQTDSFMTYPYENIRVSKLLSGDILTFNIVDDNGVKYVFDVRETSTTWENYWGTLRQETTATAWYCSIATNANQTDFIGFAYSDETTQTLNQRSVSRYAMLSWETANCFDRSPLDYEDNPRNYNNIAKNIYAINFPTGRIDFISNNTQRRDLKNGYSVDTIIVYNQENKKVKQLHLVFEYVTSGTNCAYADTTANRWLFLKEIEELDANNIVTGKYKFTYDVSAVPPCKTSPAQDFWGYYNGKNSNQDLVPSGFLDIPNASTPKYFIGANRYVDTLYTKFGILTRIDHPTGGYTQFDYENNTATDTVLPKIFLARSASIDGDQNMSSTYYTTTFTINNPTDEFLNDNNANGGAIVKFVAGGFGCDLTGGSNTCADVKITGIGNATSIPVSATSPDNTASFNAYLPNGQYKLEATFNQNPPDYHSFYMIASWSVLDSTRKPYNRLVGGIRVKQIKKHDGVSASNDMIKRFRYTTSLSGDTTSGRLFGINSLAFADHFTRYEAYKYEAFPGVWEWTSCEATYLRLKAFTNAQMVSHSGSFIGYSKVFTENIGQSGNGIMEQQFSIRPDLVHGQAPYVPLETNEHLRGFPVREAAYKSVNKILYPVSETLYEYAEQDNVSWSWGVKIGNESSYIYPKNDPGVPMSVLANYVFPLTEPYQTLSQSGRLIKKTDRLFSSGTEGSSIETVTDYLYNPTRIQLIEEKQSNSKQEVLSTKYYYSPDLTLTGEAETGRQMLVTQNNITTPLKIERYNGATLLETTQFNYKKVDGQNIVHPKNIYYGNGSIAANPIEKISFLEYDALGNLLSQQKKNDVVSSYVWGYDNRLPIAEVINAPAKDIFFTSFEDASGNSTTGDSKGGKKSKTGGYSKSLSGLTNGSYQLSYWQKSGANWVLQLSTVTVSSGSYTINLSGQVDDVRFHPSVATMTTFTHELLVGIASQEDINNRFTFYEYDAMGRLSLIRDHDRNILKKICYNYAGQPETCGVITYTSAAASGSFTRNNCGSGATGGTVTYTVPAGTYTSTISQADANQKATNDVTANGQAYANANAACTWTNQAQSGNFTRNNCGTNGTGSTITYTVAAGTHSSTASLAAANTLAINAVNAGGQAYANANAGCTWVNQAQSASFTRNNCTDGGSGGSITYTVPNGTYNSTTSLAAANTQATNAVNAGGQSYANTNAACTWTNDATSASYTRNNCSPGYIGGSLSYTINAGTYSSTVSKADANQQAVNARNSLGQANANANASCTLSVYAKLSYENINSGWGNGTYGDVVVRFYADAACTQSVSVPSLTLNLDTEGFDGSNTFSYSFTESASGSYHVLGYNAELSYDDGSTYRFRDYYLLSGSNYTVVW